jgi:hypothetical protein
LVPCDGGTFLAFDYLIDAIDREPVPAEAFDAFIEEGQPAELKDIGRAAWNWDRLDQAELAFARASDTHAEARSDGGYVIAERDGQSAQLRFLRHSVEELTAQLGDDHAETIDAKMSLAWDAGHGRSPRISLRRLVELRQEAERVLGAFHPTVLNIRRGIAMRRGEIGEMREAARGYQRLLEDCVDHLDENEWVTYGAMFGYVQSVGQGSTARRALELFDELDAWMRERRAPARFLRSSRYQRARQLWDGRQYEEALSEFEAIVADEERMRGRLNAAVLNARCDWLRCMSASGDGPRALRIARDLLAEYRASADGRHLDTWHLRFTLSTIHGEMGDVTEAARILTELRDDKVRQLGEGDPRVRQVDNRLRYWAAMGKAAQGLRTEALEELRCLSDDLLISYGVDARLRNTVVREMGKLSDAGGEPVVRLPAGG